METFNPQSALDANRNPYGFTPLRQTDSFASRWGQSWLAWTGKQAEMQWDAEQAQANREWEQMMSDTAHQREVEDMKKAGLNPAMMASGAGAATPSGSAARSHGYGGQGWPGFLAKIALSAIGGMMGKGIAAAQTTGEVMKAVTTAKEASSEASKVLKPTDRELAKKIQVAQAKWPWLDEE